ncbi:hypothetical protein Lsed01_00829 [Demequina sediminis]|uniref:Uncharacterized protein n=1 Tax=Demequina sediminis TaxID=1930058 RepID=A0ABP9WGP3_9MICO
MPTATATPTCQRCLHLWTRQRVSRRGLPLVVSLRLHCQRLHVVRTYTVRLHLVGTHVVRRHHIPSHTVRLHCTCHRRGNSGSHRTRHRGGHRRCDVVIAHECHRTRVTLTVAGYTPHGEMSLHRESLTGIHTSQRGEVHLTVVTLLTSLCPHMYTLTPSTHVHIRVALTSQSPRGVHLTGERVHWGHAHNRRGRVHVHASPRMRLRGSKHAHNTRGAVVAPSACVQATTNRRSTYQCGRGDTE